MSTAKACIAAVAVVVAACGNTSKHSAIPDPCSLLTPDDIQQATGRPPPAKGVVGALHWCSWGEAPTAGEIILAGDLNDDVCRQDESEHDETISGLGDAAYLHKQVDGYQVCVVKGNASFFVSYSLSGKDVSQATIALARAALSHLSAGSA
jgi:hypothetical protein